jgi:hypothetical protein
MLKLFKPGSLRLLSISVLLIVSACSIMPQGKPEQVLQISIESLRKQDYYTYVSRNSLSLSGYSLPQNVMYEGYVANGQVYTLGETRWLMSSNKASLVEVTPIKKLELLNALNKSTEWNQELSVNQRVIRVTLDPEAITEQIAAELREQQRMLAVDSIGQLEGQTGNLASKRRQELERVLESSNHELEEMLQSLQAECSYNLWLHTATNLPQKLHVETTMHYVLNGENKEELKTLIYEFKDYNKQKNKYHATIEGG